MRLNLKYLNSCVSFNLMLNLTRTVVHMCWDRSSAFKVWICAFVQNTDINIVNSFTLHCAANLLMVLVGQFSYYFILNLLLLYCLNSVSGFSFLAHVPFQVIVR